MDSLNHLKTTYRPRFFNRGGQKQATDIKGKNVLDCIQDRFGSCAKKFTEYSPNISCSSSPSAGQIPCQSKKISLEPAQMSCKKNAGTNFSFFVSPGKIERNSGNNESDEEILSGNIDVLPLGSPVLLEEDDGGGENSRGKQLHFNEEAFGLYNSKNFSKPKTFASNETNGFCSKESKYLVTSSNQISESEAMKSASILRNAPHVEPGDECEFLIEESFGEPSESWISLSRKKQKPQEKRLITAGNKSAKQHHENTKGKRKKVIRPTPAKQIKTTLNHAAETTFDALQNASVGNDPSQLAKSITQEGRKQIHSKGQDSIEIYNRCHQLQISTEEAQEHASLLEMDNTSSVQTQPVKSAKQCSFQNKQTTQTKKQLRTQKNKKKKSPVRLTRRKKGLSVSEKSGESEHGEEQLEQENGKKPFKLRRTIDLSKSLPQGKHSSTRSSLLNSKNSINQEDYCEQLTTLESTSSSVRQQNRHEPSQQSCALDVNLNTSGPVYNDDMSPRKEKSLSSASSCLDKSEDLHFLASNALKHKLVLPTNTPNVRRTKRMRIKPLEYWRGERVAYKRESSGALAFGGILSPEQKEPWKPKPDLIGIPLLELEKLHSDSVIIKDSTEPAVVFDTESNQEILLQCVSNGSSQVYSINNEILSIEKYLSTPSFSAGKMILKPLKEKGYQYSHKDTLVFHIAYGKLLLMLYGQVYCLNAGSYFYIPPGNVYNIRNLLNKECVVHFTQLKG